MEVLPFTLTKLASIFLPKIFKHLGSFCNESSIFEFEQVCLLSRCYIKMLANSVDSDQEQSDLGLHCLLKQKTLIP